MLLILLYLMSSLDGIMSCRNDDLKAISQAEMKFAIHMLNGQGKISASNVLLSSFSIYNCLLTVYLTSHNVTEHLMESFLRFDPDKIPNKTIIEELVSKGLPPHSKEYELTSVDRIYHTADIKIKKDFETKFKDKIAVYKISDEVNDWVSQQTKGMIKEILTKGEKPGPKTTIFVNSAYFNGNWAVPLLGKEEKKPFTLPNGTQVDVVMMSTTGLFKSLKKSSERKYITIALPYKGDDIFMIILTTPPKSEDNSKNTFSNVVKELSGPSFSSLMIELFAEKEVSTDLNLPKFSATSHYDLIETFKKIGGKDLFTKPFDLSNAFETGPVLVNQAPHKATINVYENGTVAAAASATGLGSIAAELKFHVDRPFAYFIYDKKNQLIHYAGLMLNPTLEREN